MQVASITSLISLRATWQAQVNFYTKRLSQINVEMRSPYRAASLSYLEGEKQGLERALDAASRAIDELTKIIEEAENA